MVHATGGTPQPLTLARHGTAPGLRAARGQRGQRRRERRRRRMAGGDERVVRRVDHRGAGPGLQAHRARGRGAVLGGEGQDQPRHRRHPRHQPAHRAQAPGARVREARRRDAHRGGGDGDGARAAARRRRAEGATDEPDDPPRRSRQTRAALAEIYAPSVLERADLVRADRARCGRDGRAPGQASPRSWPWLVAEIDGAVLGYCYASAYRRARGLPLVGHGAAPTCATAGTAGHRPAALPPVVRDAAAPGRGERLRRHHAAQRGERRAAPCDGLRAGGRVPARRLQARALARRGLAGAGAAGRWRPTRHRASCAAGRSCCATADGRHQTSQIDLSRRDASQPAGWTCHADGAAPTSLSRHLRADASMPARRSTCSLRLSPLRHQAQKCSQLLVASR